MSINLYETEPVNSCKLSDMKNCPPETVSPYVCIESLSSNIYVNLLLLSKKSNATPDVNFYCFFFFDFFVAFRFVSRFFFLPLCKHTRTHKENE